LPSPKKLVKEGKFLEAAKLYHTRALKTKDEHKRRRFLNFAARCYESAGDFSLAVKCFLESGDVDSALGSAIKSRNPKFLSNALLDAGRKDDAVRFLLKCTLRLVEERDFEAARSFCKEALEFGHSGLASALVNIIDGIIEGKSEKVASSVKTTQTSSEDADLAREINFIANKFLANMPKVSGVVKEVPNRCPECGAPFPAQKGRGKIIQCEYCGFTVRLD
jgi:hypothetical protein